MGLHLFAGQESADIARLEGQLERPVRRDVQFARGWLRKRLEDVRGENGQL